MYTALSLRRSKSIPAPRVKVREQQPRNNTDGHGAEQATAKTEGAEEADPQMTQIFREITTEHTDHTEKQRTSTSVIGVIRGQLSSERFQNKE